MVFAAFALVQVLKQVLVSSSEGICFLVELLNHEYILSGTGNIGV